MSAWLLAAVLRATLLLLAGRAVWPLVPAMQPGARRVLALAFCATLIVVPWLPGGVWSVGSPFSAEASPAAAGAGIFWTAAGVLWAAGTAAGAARLLRGVWELRTVLASAGPAVKLPAGCHSQVTVRVSSHVAGPCVAGFLHPVLLVPASCTSWDAATWRCVIAHETAHLEQRDVWTAWLPRLAAVLWWWHPLAHWLARQYHLEAEIGCDRAVIAAGASPRDYAETLLALNARLFPRTAHPMARPSGLRTRLTRLLAPTTAPRALGLRLGLAACGVILASLAAAALSLRHGPTPATAPLENEALVRLAADPFPADR